MRVVLKRKAWRGIRKYSVDLIGPTPTTVAHKMPLDGLVVYFWNTLDLSRTRSPYFSVLASSKIAWRKVGIREKETGIRSEPPRLCILRRISPTRFWPLLWARYRARDTRPVSRFGFYLLALQFYTFNANIIKYVYILPFNCSFLLLFFFLSSKNYSILCDVTSKYVNYK